MKKLVRQIISVAICVIMIVAATALFASAKTFPDVKSTDWYYSFVTYMSDKEIINGYTSDGTFRANNYVKRSEFIKMLNETFGLEKTATVPYTDVKSGDWYYEVFGKAVAQGYINTIHPNTYKINPTDELTREEAVALLMAYLDLPVTEVASSDKFEDYLSIKSEYRVYVLQAIEAGIIDGFENSDGTYSFRPEETLRRAQAAKILSVAAGTIANDTEITELDADENLVVTESGVTLKDLIIKGNIYISEGISGGNVTFIDCYVYGRVFNRSTSTVVFSNCFVNEINIGAANAIVNFKQGSSVAAMNVNAANVNVGLSNEAKVTKLTVARGATNVTVKNDTANSEITNLVVNAAGLDCKVAAKKVTLATGVSATIGGTKYSGGFKGDVKLTWTTTADKLTVTPYVSGKVQYYYSSSSTKPNVTSQTFNNSYTLAPYKDSFDVSANTLYSDKALTSSALSIESYPYIVLALVEGSTVHTPVVISRLQVKTGFTALPTVGTASSNETIKFTAPCKGTLYYYYTNDKTLPATYTAALLAYNSAATEIKGIFTLAASTAAVTKTTKATSAVSLYSYCVAFICDDTGFGYYPVLVERPTATDGFKVAPEIIKYAGANNDKDILTFTATKAGTIKWFYTDSDWNWNPQLFNAVYSAFAKDDTTHGEDKTVKAGTAKVIELLESAKVTNKYVVVMLTDSDGTVHTPVMLARKLTSTGFEKNTTPIAYGNGTKGLVSFKVAEAGSVRFMYVSSNNTYTVESFNAEFKKVEEADGTLALEKQAPVAGEYSVISAINSNIKYVALMFTDLNGNHYTPVTVRITAVGSGFRTIPTVNTYISDNLTILKGDLLIENAQIKYFETAVDISGVTNDSFAEIGGGAILTVPADKHLNIASNAKYVFVMVVITDGTSEFEFEVQKIQRNKIYYGIKDGDFSVSLNQTNIYDTVSVKTDVKGTVKYYYTNTLPTTIAGFNSGYNAAKLSGYSDDIAVEAGTLVSADTFPVWMVSSYRYIVFMLTDVDGVNYLPGSYDFGEDLRTLISVDDSVLGKLTVTSETSGNVYVIHSKTSRTDISASTFATRYEQISNNSTTLKKDVAKLVTQGASVDVTLIDGYNYVYIVLVDGNSKYYIPYSYVVATTTTP